MDLMWSQTFRRSAALISLFILSSATILAQQGMIMRPSVVPQPMTVAPPPPPPPHPSLIRPTVSSSRSIAAPDIAQPALEPVALSAGGILVETVDGKTVMDSLSSTTFNPASNVKLATAFAVLKTLKPTYRYPTKIYTDGVLNAATGVIEGNLYVVGSDPSFNYEHGVSIAAALNQIGVRQVHGDLIVSTSFAFGYTPSALRSGVLLYNTLDASRRSAAAVNAWQTHLLATGETVAMNPNVVVTGSVSSEELPTKLRLLVTHESSQLKDILKACLSYSNNFLAERLGNTIGGASSVERIVAQEAHIAPEEFQIASASGLGVNRVTPRAMMKVFRALHGELAKLKMSITDVLPVAGVDEGTLKNRFADFKERGSVIGKTGTLPETDGGVSSLVGQLATAKGEMLFFVIFNQRGNVNRFRDYQNKLVTFLQNQRGGPMSFSYLPKSFPALLANTRVTIEKTVN